MALIEVRPNRQNKEIKTNRGRRSESRPRGMADEKRDHTRRPGGKKFENKIGIESTPIVDITQPATPLTGNGEKAPNEKVLYLPSHDEVLESYKEWLAEQEERLKGPQTDEEIIRRATLLHDVPLSVVEYMELEKVAQRMLTRELERIDDDPDMLADDKDIAREDARFDYGGHIVPLQDRLDGVDASKLIPKPPRQQGIEIPEIPPDELPIYEASRKESEARIAEIDAMKLPKSEKLLLKFGLLKGGELERRLEDHRTNRDFAELVWKHEVELEETDPETEDDHDTFVFSYDDVDQDNSDEGTGETDQTGPEDYDPTHRPEGYDDYE